MKSVLESIRWPAALVIVAALGTILGLVAMGENLTAVGVFIAGLLAYIAQQRSGDAKTLEKVESNTNGSLTALRVQNMELQQQMIDMARQHARDVAVLAQQLPLTAQLPPGLGGPLLALPAVPQQRESVESPA